jgi:hypothetical protein
MATITPAPAVLIDACVPRNGQERYGVLLDYLQTVDPFAARNHVADMELGIEDAPGTGGEWHEAEDSILRTINEILPDDLICTLGEFHPGDVIVREIGPDENDLDEDL